MIDGGVLRELLEMTRLLTSKANRSILTNIIIKNERKKFALSYVETSLSETTSSEINSEIGQSYCFVDKTYNLRNRSFSNKLDTEINMWLFSWMDLIKTKHDAEIARNVIYSMHPESSHQLTLTKRNVKLVIAFMVLLMRLDDIYRDIHRRYAKDWEIATSTGGRFLMLKTTQQ